MVKLAGRVRGEIGEVRRRAGRELRGYLVAVAINVATVGASIEGRPPRGAARTWIVARGAGAFAEGEMVDCRTVLTVPLTSAAERTTGGRAFDLN